MFDARTCSNCGSPLPVRHPRVSARTACYGRGWGATF